MKTVARPTITLAILLLPFLAGSAQAQTRAAAPADVASPETIVLALYETVNREPGRNFDWVRMRTLFLPTATMIPAVEQTGGVFRILTVEDFINWIDQNTVVGGANDRGFQEEQIAQHVEQYGDIAQVFSTYQKHFWRDTNILGRGINSIQLVNNEGRWWIVSVIWDEEVGAGALPARYLTK